MPSASFVVNGSLRYAAIYIYMSLYCLYDLMTGVSPNDPMTAKPNDHKRSALGAMRHAAHPHASYPDRLGLPRGFS